MPTFAVTLVHGPGWDTSRPIRRQQAWDEHAAFMDGLVDDGFIVVGGPLGDGSQTLHLLQVGSIRPWALWLDGRHTEHTS